MFKHTHPYPPYFPEEASKLIVGTLPPPRFTTGELKERDVNFCYGSQNGLLWPVLDQIFNLNLKFENTEEAVWQRKQFLKKRGIGICDIVSSCKRTKIDASDLGMQDIKLRDLISYLQQYPKIDTLLFTGGNSKNGPEYLFRKHSKEYNISLELISNEVPRIHQFDLPNENKQDDKVARIIRTVSLTAPSGAANRSIGSSLIYKKRKQESSHYNTMDYRVEQYKNFF